MGQASDQEPEADVATMSFGLETASARHARFTIQILSTPKKRARRKYQGTVVLAIVVDPSGHPRDVRVARSLGMGLDQKAVEAVEKWKFTPGLKDGMAVAVQVNVEVSFRLY